MFTLLKWIAVLLISGLLWLVGVYTDEYFRPYKQIKVRLKK